ncbi:MAG: twin-arginine translocation signal domain-containing protein [Candidatus Latescibacteria bacterium]|nr:twin-arginine translocation signal domain-containing protein [Candidatus Latescibacterota bacterium]
MDTPSRRKFIKNAAIGGVAAGMGLTTSGFSPGKASGYNRTFYRDLGSTGFKASEIGFGVLHITDTALIHAALDGGINFFDTAHGYMNGRCEETLGKINKTRRKEYFLATKVSGRDPEKLRKEIDISLKRLQTDCVDLLMSHGPSKKELVLNEDIMKVFDDARKAGKTRFIGISTHNHDEVPDAVISSKFWETLLTPYNYFSPPKVTAYIKRAREAGIAYIAMKALITVERPRKPFPDIREGKTGTTNQQALLKWVLNNRYVDTVIPGMSSFEHIADDIGVMGMKLAHEDRQILRRYSEAAKGQYCRGIAGCTECSDKCPKGVDVCEINRCINYAYGYGNVNLARENYRALPESSRVDMCGDCEECAVTCVNGLDITRNINQAKELFA